MLCFFCYSILAQELPPLQNFTPLDYSSGNQNWAISQSQDKLIYVANNEGLLEFNGAKWKLYRSPNKTIMRSVTIIEEKIFTGCYMDFGFWKKNNFGILEYTSLSQRLNLELIEDEEFWHIVGIEDWVVFQSLNRIYIYDRKRETTSIIDSKDVINKMFELDETIYFQKLNKGIYKIENGADSLFLDHQVLRENEIVNLFMEKDKFLILTRNNGFFSYKDGLLERWGNIDDKLDGLSVYSAIRLRNKNFVLGTIANGLVCLNEHGEIMYNINQSNGILNNTVLSVFEDVDDNIWSGLDNGISYVNINAPIKIFNDKSGILGSIYTSAILNDTIYLGTNQGLFLKPLSADVQFSLIDGTQGQVWCLTVIDNTLFCGHHEGTFIVEGDRVKEISNIQGAWNIKSLNENPNLIIQGNYDGLYILNKSNDNWYMRNKIDGFDNSSRSFEILEDKIFVNHEYKGVFHLTVDQNFSAVTKVSIDTLLKGANSSITKYKGDILYAYEKGVFKYDSYQNTFKRDSILSNIYSEEDYTSGKIVPNDEGDKFWVFTKDNLTLVSSGKLSSIPKVQTFPLTLDVRRDVIEYENIINLNAHDQYVFGTSSGYMTIDINELAVKDLTVYIGNVSNGINKDHSASKNLIDNMKKGDFGSDENNLRIDFYTPTYYAYLKPTYQFQLLGIYDVWSEWTSESSVFFENLPPGDYTFNVKAKIGEKVSENMASYSFNITKPWYISNVMLVAYVLAVFLFSIFMHYLYRGYYHNQQKKLIEKNKRELEFANLQNEKEIIKIKNERLSLDYKSKSKELAATTMSMVKKNELLSEIKELLTRIEDKKSLAPVIKIIDKSLNHDENWEFFREAFDNADSEFFKKLKNLHPDLSPNDLKLCAYLRLNLSSKEIAQLINISPKSVEIKRYRLRKKMSLTSNENLTDYILNI